MSIFSASTSSAFFAAAFADRARHRARRRCRPAGRRTRPARCGSAATARRRRPCGHGRRLPLRHQVAVARGGRAPILGVGELLGLDDQLLLAGLGAGALPVQVGEVRTAAAVERLAGLGEPLPQQLVGLAVDAADRPPLVEDRLEPVAGLLPLGGLDGERLGLDGERLLPRHRSGALRVAGRPGGSDRLLGQGDELVEPGPSARRRPRPPWRRRARHAWPWRCVSACLGSPPPAVSRAASSSASVSRSSNRRAKCASPSCGAPACHDPTIALAVGRA